jgi:hypothetical protein
MPRKKTANNRQLTLFERGLDAPPSTKSLLARRQPIAKPEPEIIEPTRQPRSIPAGPMRLKELESDGREPSPFERESYNLYLRYRDESRSLSGRSTFLFVLLLFAAVLRIPIQEVLGVKFAAQHLFYIIGFLGWAALLSICYAIFIEILATRKKRQCGLFYQRVLRFSDYSATIWMRTARQSG